MIRQGKSGDALLYIKGFSKNFAKDHFDEIQKALGCLIGYEHIKHLPRYQYYFEEQRRKDLVKLFKEDNFKVFSLTKAPFINTMLQVGISALKTHYCHNKKYQKQGECPICDEIMLKVSSLSPSLNTNLFIV